jgi:hypothetical protein
MDGVADNHLEPEEKFQPWGAVAFFVLLMMIIVGIWFSMFAVMLSRT